MRFTRTLRTIQPLFWILLLGAIGSGMPASEEGKNTEPARALIADDLTTASSTASSPVLASPKVVRYAERLIAQYDRDQSGNLTAEEWASMRGQPARMDGNQDGKVILDEIVSHIVAYNRTRQFGGRTIGSDSQSPAKRRLEPEPETATNASSSSGQPANADKPYHVPVRLLPTNLPSWFTERDLDGDGQLALAEYAPQGGRDAVAAFTQLDTDHDGLLTPTECTDRNQSKAAEETEP
ncbi:MAG: hypothetical protein JW829_20800 [Pirellulales bacterium]|nr:hypothetical protein [Pirellulales bacterium]